MSSGKKLTPFGLLEEVKVVVLVKGQKVFVVDLGKKMNSSCHKA